MIDYQIDYQILFCIQLDHVGDVLYGEHGVGKKWLISVHFWLS